MNRRRLFKRLTAGDVHNVRFTDFMNLVEAFGFELQRTEGSHHMFWHPGILEMLNVQAEKGQAKPYQIRHFVRLVERYNLRLEE